jgi:hypothetical protein
MSPLKVISNRFITAKFDADTLLSDFMKMISSTCEMLPYSADINNLLMDQLLLDMQIAAIDRLLENPGRFTFTNAIVWSSFLTTLQADLDISLPYLKEFVLALNMAPAFRDTPDLAPEVCPNIPLPVIAYLMASFVPDKLYTSKLSPVVFMREHKLAEIPKSPFLPDPELVRFVPLPEIPWDKWPACNFAPKALQAFPFIRNYLRK